MDVDGLAHGLDALGAQAIEGGGSETGHDARLAANAAGVFAQGDVADVMIAGLDAPVGANGASRGLASRRIWQG